MPVKNATVAIALVNAVVSTLCCIATSAANLQVYPRKGQVIQRLEVFDNPEGAIFSDDGKHVFISNAAELGMPDKGFHWTHGRGYISKLEVQPDGTLKMVKEQLIAGLTGPLGMAVSTVATARFPRGTIFVSEAWLGLAEADGTEVRDPKILDPKIIAFNTEGKILGAIKLGAGSVAAKVSGVIATLANSVAFDTAGNLYLADTGVPGNQFEPPLQTKGGGVYMFPIASLDALAEGRTAPLHYVPTPDGGPDGIEVAPDGTVHVNTVGLNAGLKDPAEGGMYKLTQADIVAGRLPPPFNRGLGALDGLAFAGNNRLDTEARNTNGILVTPLAGRTTYMLAYDKPLKVNGPADIAVRRMSDGSYLLILPELSGTTPNKKRNPVNVIKLPAAF